MVDTTKYSQGFMILLVAMAFGLVNFPTAAFDVSKPQVESSAAKQLQRRPFVVAGMVGLIGGIASGNLDQKDVTSTIILDSKPEWSGTHLPRISLDEAYERSLADETFDFAHWPDPILRESTSRMSLTQYQREDPSALHKIQRIAQVLEQTAQKEGAVGLAAQQCGIDLSLVYLEQHQPSKRENLFLFNPRIVSRSPESEMKVWTEQCLVLPPDFRATLLRDRTVEVEYECVTSCDLNDGVFLGKTKRIKLRGELARAVQHEMDHDRGILIVDHIDLGEMSPYMREIERNGHDDRMALAFSRNIESDF